MNYIFEAAKFEPEIKFENTNNDIKDNHLKNIASAAANPSAITFFEEYFDPLFNNKRIEATKFEPETTFENTMNYIKANHLKSITSIDMNLSAITSNKPSFCSEHLKFDLMPWILLQSLESYQNSPIIFLQCTLMETPNYRFENGGFL